MPPNPEITAKVMKLKWKKGLSLKEAWSLVKKPKKKTEKKEEKPKKKTEKPKNKTEKPKKKTEKPKKK